MNTLVLPNAIVEMLRRLFDEAPLESAGVLFCRQARGRHDCKLLAVEYVGYEPDEYLERTKISATIDPAALNARIQKAKRDDLALVQVHTHPSCEHATFSTTDSTSEGVTIPVISRRVPGRVHGSLVLGRSASSSRFYDADAQPRTARILTVGQSVERLDRVRVIEENRFARTYLAIGKQGQADLQEMKIGVVGLGGLGSLVAEQLSYLGVRHAVLIDPDTVDETNLNRVVGAYPSDIDHDKIQVAAFRYLSVLPSATLDLVSGSVIDESVARSLIDCDLVFCCTDGHGSRAVLSAMAYQYFLPIIDVGVEIDVEEDRVKAVAGRVQLVGPDMPCLYCCETINAARVREEFLTVEECERDAYVTGAAVKQPAVVPFNGVMASLATTILIGMSTRLPLSARMQTFNAMSGQVRPAETIPREGCPFCSEGATLFGLADSAACVWRKSADAVRRCRLVGFSSRELVRTQAEALAIAEGGGIGVVMAGTRAKMAVFTCPCGCGHVLRINLMREMGRSWHEKMDSSGLLTLAPSVNLSSGCQSHFTLTSNVARMIF